MAIKIFPYNMASEAANALAHKLHCRLIKIDRNVSRYRPTGKDMIINWGNTNPWINPEEVGMWLNLPNDVNNVSNKLKFFQTHNGKFNHPRWTTDKQEAILWLAGGWIVVVRHEIAGMGGEGIEIIEPIPGTIQDLPNAPLYTRYVPKAAEYRVHVFFLDTIDVQQKVKREGVEGNFRVRTHDNGFVFARNVGGRPVIETVPACVLSEAERAVTKADLDFGGVDVIYNRRENKAYVLEINSAPGIEGQTVDSYATAFSKYHHDVRRIFNDQ